MKSVRMILVFIAGLLSHYGAFARTTNKIKNDDHYIKIENDISNGAPVLPIEGGYKDQEDVTPAIEGSGNIYDVGSFYNMANGYAIENPYYYYYGNVYEPKNFYYPEFAPFSESEYDPEHSYPSDDEHQDEVPEGTIISESESHDDAEHTKENEEGVEEQNQEREQEEEKPRIIEDKDKDKESQVSEGGEEEEREEEEEYVPREDPQYPMPYWSPPESSHIVENPYMMAIPAQFQSFPIFDPNYYHTDFEEYERMAAEAERKRQELEERTLESNIVDNPEDYPRGGRVRRGFSRMLNLRNKNGDGASHGNAKGITGNSEKESVVLNADCRGGGGNGGGGGGGRRPNNGGAGGGTGGIPDPVASAQDAAGQATGAAQDAASQAENAVDNLRLASRRANNGRRNNRNNGRGVEKKK